MKLNWPQDRTIVYMEGDVTISGGGGDLIPLLRCKAYEMSTHALSKDPHTFDALKIMSTWH